MESQKPLPQDFEPIKYLESEKINSMFEITKSPDWEKTIPELLNTVERYQSVKKKKPIPILILPLITQPNTFQN